MKKIIFIMIHLALFAGADDFKDNTPNEISKQDAELIMRFEKTIYQIAEETKQNKINIGAVTAFIWANKLHEDNYNPVKISANAEIGNRSQKGLNVGNEGNIFLQNSNFYKTSLALTYDFYDQKTKNEIRNKELDYKNKIVEMVQNLSKAKIKANSIKKNLKLKRLEQIRDKVMQHTAQKYLDERLKTIEEINKINDELENNEIEIEAQKEKILNLVNPLARKKLNEML